MWFGTELQRPAHLSKTMGCWVCFTDGRSRGPDIGFWGSATQPPMVDMKTEKARTLPGVFQASILLPGPIPLCPWQPQAVT